jgi:hypothetical protein
MREVIVYTAVGLPPFRSTQDIEDAVANEQASILTPSDVPAPPPSPPSLLQKAANFATSAAAHVAAGMPQASQEQIDARFAICQTCDQFDGKACRLCGCPVVREKAFVSKLSWANEKCPAGKWGPVES